MKNNPNRRRRSIRLPGYDYSQPGAYFITIVTHGRACLFGEVVDGQMRLNDVGRVVEEVWNSLPGRFSEINLGIAVVMPNHFHGILERLDVDGISVGAIHELPLPDRRRMTLPLVIGYFKMNTAKQINILRNTRGVPVWQRNYYEHIIRNDDDYHLVYQYIAGNPACWLDDGEFFFQDGHNSDLLD
jgi:REP element-mobilizing transposase RayT